MTTTVIATFHNKREAISGLTALRRLGFPKRRIHVKTDEPTMEWEIEGDMIAWDAERAIGVRGGAIVGAVTGFVIGLAALFIPALGPFIVTGPLAMFLSILLGALSGALVAPVLDMFMGAGASAEDTRHYLEGLSRGPFVVSADVDDSAGPKVVSVFQEHGAREVTAVPTELSRENSHSPEGKIRTGQDSSMYGDSMDTDRYDAASNHRGRGEGFLDEPR